MGLDSYVLRVRKVSLEDRVYDRTEIRDLGLSFFLKDDTVEELHADLLPYCSSARIREDCVDLNKIREDYGLSEKSFMGWCSGDGAVGMFDPERENEKSIAITAAEAKKKYLVEQIREHWVFKSEEVAYWRKNYSVQDFFYDQLERVQNTGFYLLNTELLEAFNETHDSSWGYLPAEEPTDQEALFYHEWY